MPVKAIDRNGVTAGERRVPSGTVLWAAGVQASPLGKTIGVEIDAQGRIVVEPDLSIRGHANVFVAGDQARFTHQTGKPLPGTAPVAMQQGRYVARTILDEIKGESRKPFVFADKGQMATIGRSKAIVELRRMEMAAG
jgi:NADH dehydrogenase